MRLEIAIYSNININSMKWIDWSRTINFLRYSASYLYFDTNTIQYIWLIVVPEYFTGTGIRPDIKQGGGLLY